MVLENYIEMCDLVVDLYYLDKCEFGVCLVGVVLEYFMVCYCMVIFIWLFYVYVYEWGEVQDVLFDWLLVVYGSVVVVLMEEVVGQLCISLLFLFVIECG